MITLLGVRLDLDWFHNHADREIIRRWTVAKPGETPRHELAIEGTPEPQTPWTFLVLGDTGDSDRFGSRISPQRAVATMITEDCGLSSPTSSDALPVDSSMGAPPLQPAACMVLHTGDVNYLTGEERLYDLNFIDPYRAFQTSESHYKNLTFRIPFLPVPGNHDYYDLHRWMGHIMKIGSWVGLSKLFSHFFHRLQLPMPFGGSEMGATYMNAFVNQEPDAPEPLPYQLGVKTKLPNRYYQFRRGNVHFFALDSNTLDAPPPGEEDPWKEKATAIVERTEKKLGRLNEQVERDRAWEEEEELKQREAMRAGEREEIWPRLRELLTHVADNAEALSSATKRWSKTLETTHPDENKQLNQLIEKNDELHTRWRQALEEASKAPQPVVAYETQFETLLDLQEAWLLHFVERDKLTVTLPASPEYEAAQQARLALDAKLGQWCRERVGPELPGPCALPAVEEDEATEEETVDANLGEAILDTQRDLAMARKISQRSDEDYDAVQIEWLRTSLAAVKAEEEQRQLDDSNARIWRVVYLHHPIYTTLPGHTERSDSVGVRQNLEAILQEADLVLTGHSHGFEWLHSSAAPHQCYLVTGAGGQNRLQGSIFSPQLAARYQPAIQSLNKAGLDSLVWASGEPVETGSTVEEKLFSYLRIRVLEDELQVEPVGARQIPVTEGESNDQWERLYPLPVHEVPEVKSWLGAAEGATEGTTNRRLLKHIKIQRGQAPVAMWAE
jgi:hypothetical protein